MNNRILAMLLAIIMIVSIVPVNAFAAENADCTCTPKHVHSYTDCGWEATSSNPVCNHVCAPAAECSHTFDTTAARVSTNDGNHKVECNKCHEKVSFECKFDSDTDYKCDWCGYIKDHTCTDAGNNHLCDICEKVVHKMTKVEAKAPTHAESGNIEYWVCGTCTNFFEDEAGTKKIEDKNSVNLNAIQHTLEWTITEDTHKYACTGCLYDPVDEEPHEFAYDKATNQMVCGECGYKYDHVCVDTADGGNHRCDDTACLADMEETHTVVWHSNGSGQHFKKCSDTKCYTYYNNKGGALTEWEDCVDTDNDCICNTCGGQMQHTLIDVEAKAATCAEDGNIAHKKCTNCNGTFDADGNAVDPVTTLDHWEIWAQDEENGTHYKVCKRSACQKVLSEPEAHEVPSFPSVYDTEHQGVCSICNLVVTEDHNDSPDDEDCSCDDCGKFLGHTLKQVAKVDAKCGVDGNKAHQLCEKCGKTFDADGNVLKDVTIQARKHWAIWQYDVETDTHKQVCKYSNCKAVIVEPTAHDYVYTDQGDGTHTATCPTCKYGEVRDHMDEEAPFCKCDECGAELAHTGVYVEWLPATCTTDGHTDYYQCTKCELKYLSNGQETDPLLPALTHDWSEARPIPGSVYHSYHCQRPGCNGARIEMHADENDDCVCDVESCGAFAHGAIKYMEPVAATCTENGHQGYYYYDGCSKKFADEAGTTVLAELIVYGATGHNENGEWEPCDDGEHHEKFCLTCDAFLYSAEHTFNGENPYCVDCGTPDGLEFQPEVPATCTRDGVKAHYKSSITQRRYWDAAGTRYISNVSQLVIPAQHDLTDWMPGRAGEHVRSCKRDGCNYMENGTCSSNDSNCVCDVCGYMMPGHTMTYVEAKEATCTKNGNLAAWYCAKCDKYYDAESVECLPTVVIPAHGHRFEANWYNDTREGAHSKDCLLCNEKVSEEHVLTVEDLYSGNLHEWSCSVCNYSDSEMHKYNGDTICDDCDHDSGKTVDVGSLDNPRETIKIKGDKDDTVEEKKSTWWKSFVDKLNPSYVGESQSTSAPSNSVENPLPNGSGISSGSTGASQNAAPATNPSTVGAVIDFLLNLLSDLFGL